MAKWIGVDLDGTLSESVDRITARIGKPVPPMMRRVRGWLSQGKEVRIMTARAGDPEQVKKIRAWLDRHDIAECGVTDRKDIEMVALYDDKAVRVIKDRGMLCTGCRAERHSADGHAQNFTPSPTNSQGDVLTDC